MPSVAASQTGMSQFEYRNQYKDYNGVNNDMAYNHDDTFDREEMMRREEDDRFKRGFRNGGNGAYDRFDYLADRDRGGPGNIGGGEPEFLLDHLATFAAGTRSGMLHAEDGLRKLRQMENTTGIWTMRCVLVVERGFLVIYDYTNGEELERFPIQSVTDPTAIFKNDHREHYNSLILFTIVEDPKKKATPADMHIFQTCGGAPPQMIVDEILASKSGQPRLGGNGASKIPPPPAGPAPEPPNDAYNFNLMRENIDTTYSQTQEYRGNQFGAASRVPNQSILARVSSIREKEDIDGGATEIMERDVQLLNHCFDDIEKFVARLQQAAEAFKELERRKKERNAKNKKKQSGGEGMLNARARPPIARDFVDIFQKFKLSFNLLAKLKAHIHDPNAPELVHFLFTPLSLIYEASRDPLHGNQNLGDQAVAPVLTTDAKLLLQNCLTSKELELWHALGKHWTTSRSEWQGHIPPYAPEFFNGWKPAGSMIDDTVSRSASMHQIPTLPLSEPLRQPPLTDIPISYRSEAPARPTPFPDEDRPQLNERYNGNMGNVNHAFTNNGPSIPLTNFNKQNGEVDRGFNTPMMSRQSENSQYLKDLMRTDDALIYEAAHDRRGKNNKELDVQRGDIFHVLDNSKNWWKLRNYKGVVGFAPYTILKAVRSENGDDQTGGPIQSRAETVGNDSDSYYDYPPSHHSKQEPFSYSASVKPHQRSPSPPGLEQRSLNLHFSSSGPSRGEANPNQSWINPAPSPSGREQRPSSIRLPSSGPSRGDTNPNQSWMDAAASLDIDKLSPQDVVMRNQAANKERARNSADMKQSPYRNSLNHYQASTPPPPPPLPQQQPPAPLPRTQHHPSHPPSQTRPGSRLDFRSSPTEVTSWLLYKEFRSSTREMFAGYNGSDMFALQLEDLQDVLPHEEAIRLDGLLRLQKNASGYRTNSAKELNAILQKRKQLVSNNEWKDQQRDESVTDFRDERLMRDINQQQQQQQQSYYNENIQLRKPKEQERVGRPSSSLMNQPMPDTTPDYIMASKSRDEGKDNFRDLLVRQRSQLRQSQNY